MANVYFVAKLNLKAVGTNMQVSVLKFALPYMSNMYTILLQQFARLAALNEWKVEH